MYWGRWKLSNSGRNVIRFTVWHSIQTTGRRHSPDWPAKSRVRNADDESGASVAVHAMLNVLNRQALFFSFGLILGTFQHVNHQESTVSLQWYTNCRFTIDRTYFLAHSMLVCSDRWPAKTKETLNSAHFDCSTQSKMGLGKVHQK